MLYGGYQYNSLHPDPSFIYISIWRVLRINACYSRLDPDLIPFMRHLWVPACAGMTE